MKTVRIGMIGLGDIANAHLRNYSKIPGVEVVAASDINLSTLETVSDKFDIKNRYPDFKEMLKRDDLDAVDVCLHNHLHRSAAIQAMQAGKHVYCEKPIASTYKDGKAMLDFANECGKMLQIQLMLVFADETKCAKRLIDAGNLGRVFYARAAGYRRRGRPYVDGRWPIGLCNQENTGGGAIIDMAIYKLGQMLYLLGNPNPLRISGKLFQEKDMYEDRRVKSRFNVEELGMGFVKFENDILLDLIEAWAINIDDLGGDFLVGSKGGVRLTPEFKFISTIEDMEATTTVDLEDCRERWHGMDPLAEAYDSPQQHWVSALRGDVPLINSAEIALTAMLIQEGIYLSDQLGREVSAQEVIETSPSKAIPL